MLVHIYMYMLVASMCFAFVYWLDSHYLLFACFFFFEFVELYCCPWPDASSLTSNDISMYLCQPRKNTGF